MENLAQGGHEAVTAALREAELDALKEVANIGAGHAATALNQLIGRRVMIDVPEVEICTIERAATAIGNAESVVAAVLLQMLGDLTGRCLMLFDKNGALELVDTLLKREPGTTRMFADLEQSALKETANILTGAYMGGLSDLLGLMLIPSVPSLAVDMGAAVLSTAYLSFGTDRDRVIILDTRFHFEPDMTLTGHFVLLPDPPSLNVILRACRIV